MSRNALRTSAERPAGMTRARSLGLPPRHRGQGSEDDAGIRGQRLLRLLPPAALSNEGAPQRIEVEDLRCCRGGGTKSTWKRIDAVVAGCGMVTVAGRPARSRAARAGGRQPALPLGLAP